jgi:hypothetical protein
VRGPGQIVAVDDSTEPQRRFARGLSGKLYARYSYIERKAKAGSGGRLRCLTPRSEARRRPGDQGGESETSSARGCAPSNSGELVTGRCCVWLCLVVFVRCHGFQKQGGADDLVVGEAQPTLRPLASTTDAVCGDSGR